MTKLFTRSPLPFVGQKRNFIRQYKEVLSSLPPNTTIVDLFGGSGLLSHVAKRYRPDCTVVYNDFDHFERRLNSIQTTNELLSKVRDITANLPRSKPIPEPQRTAILELIEQEERTTGYVDYITLSSSLLFSSNTALCIDDLRRTQLWHTVRRTPYTADGYLDGLHIVSADYREVFKQYKDIDNVIFVVDPPYLSTDCSSYTMRWTLADYLDVLTILNGHRFIYFTSNKSNILELCDWLGNNPSLGNPFANCTKIEFETTLNYSSKYTDIMLYN